MILLRYLRRLHLLIKDQVHDSIEYSQKKHGIAAISIFCCYSEVMITFAAFFFYLYSKAVRYDQSEELVELLQNYD